MSEQKHTPTPWKVEIGRWMVGEGGIHVAQFMGGGERETRADIAFTLRAVNSHEALVEALKPFSEQKCYGAESGFARACINTPTCPTCAARAAIAKAEGGS